MPTVGLEYRYPFIGVQSWGTQTIEPIAQIIVRPNEPNIGRLPNEDSQSLVFDDTNLFKVDKFSGWDRVEGGGRANVGVQYTAQFNRGGYCQRAVRPVLPAVRHQLVRGRRRHQHRPQQRPRHQRASDYVARLHYQPNRIYQFISRFRFDESRFHPAAARDRGARQFRPLERHRDVRQLRGPARARLPRPPRRHAAQHRLSSSTRTGSCRPAMPLRHRRPASSTRPASASAISTTASCCRLNYITDYTYSGNVQTNNTVMLQMSLRTLGGPGGMGQ